LDIRSYTIRRLVASIPALVFLSFLIFSMTRVVGDPAAIYADPNMTREQLIAIRKKYHLDEPIYVQYIYFLQGVFQGDLGYSVIAASPVTVAIQRFFPATLELALFAMLLSLGGGIYLGTKSAVHKDKTIDHATRILALSGHSMPLFWLGLILLYVFYFQLRTFGPGRLDPILQQTHFPPVGSFRTYTGLLTLDALLNFDWEVLIDAVKHLIFPVITLGYGNMAVIARITRSSMLEVLSQDYVKYARAKGVPEPRVIVLHARRNALIPVTTVGGLTFALTLGGAVLTEVVFNWPGMGTWAARAAISLDHAAVLGFVMFIGAIYIVSNLVVDILYVYLDPRVRLK